MTRKYIGTIKNWDSELGKIIIENANYVKLSGFTLTQDDVLPSLLLTNGEDKIFFQEESARDILDEANKLYEKTGNTTTPECIMSIMKGWVENL